MKPSLAWLALSLPLIAAPAHARAPEKPIRIILVGDSTMASNTGYGDALCRYVAPGNACINLARGGRSSGSFRAEKRWDEVQALLRDGAAYRGTFVLVQFGHNDQPGKPGRSTDLVTEFPANMARYVSEAKALGAVPVLVTPLTRRSFRGRWLHDDLGPWSAATRRVAQQYGVALVDLNALSAQAVQAMGSAQADTLAQEPRPPEGAPKNRFDHTHLGPKGAALFAGIVAGELRRVLPALAPALSNQPAATLDPARQAAPSDGWANAQSGTQGGAAATDSQVFTVSNRAQLLHALASGSGARIVKVAGTIDMSEGRPFASTADQAARGAVDRKSVV
jgi:lysophospholipase L1-like esterase